MPRARLSIATLLVIAAAVVSCTDRPAPTEAATAMGRRVGASATGCLALGDLNNLVITVFGTANMPNQNSALHKLDQVTKALAKGNTADAIAKANDLISFIRLKATELAVQAQAQALIEAIECYAGIDQNTFLVYPSDNPQTITSEDGQAGIVLPVNPVTEPTLITITMLDPNGTSPLITKLDKYPGYVELTQQSGVANSLTGAVTIAVCPVAGIPDSIASRLRLGHQAAPGAAGFEVTPYANASFLTCAGYASATSRLPGWLRAVASLVMPKPLYARMNFSGGVGGTAEEFSPFGPIDPELSFSGGVGGTAEEFIKEQPTSPATGKNKKQPSATDEAVQGKTSVRSSTAEMAVNIITCYQAEVGASATAITGCRPQVTLKTVNQTPFVGVPVTFAVGATGGSVAADAASACGALGSSATVLTDVNGVARACWTLGDVAADYTVTATPANGGDAIAGVTFSQASYTWTTTAIKKSATLTLDNVSQTYDGTGKSVAVTTAPAALPGVSVTYNGSADLPVNAGSYAVVATLNNPSYQGTISGTLVINKATANVTVGDLTPTYSGSPTAATATTDATGTSAFSFTYDGSPTAPTNAGSYAVVATLNNDNFSGSATGTLIISKAPATLTLANLTGTYSGSSNNATVTTLPVANLESIVITYDGSPAAPVNAGSYAVVATLDNPNYSGSTTGTLVIGKATATVLLGSLTATYDGASKTVAATTIPAGLGAISITYNGSAPAPSNAGSYAVLVTLTNANYVGSASGTLVISPAGSVITWATPAPIILGTPLSGSQLNATASTTGAFAYTPPAGSVLPAGTSTLSTFFTPSTTNYSAAAASVSIKVFYKQVGCFASPVYSSMPDTKSYQRKGSNLPVKCTLTTASGASVTNATGSLKIEDLGTNPNALATDANPLVIGNAFVASSNGNYSYGLNTGVAKFITLHYYRATAQWNDGNTTVGYFFVK